MILVIDNYDSFTYNLVQYFGELGETLAVHRNDALSLDDIRAMAPDAIVVSPGPCTPAEAGVSVAVIREFGPTVPLLGVCLGHQAIGEAFGGTVLRARRVMHGKRSQIVHDGSGLFDGVPSPFQVMRYHSLVVEHASLPSELEITAVAADDATEIHALRHREYPIWGVQFHPESILTEHGKTLLVNFLAMARDAVARAQAGSSAGARGLMTSESSTLPTSTAATTPRETPIAIG
ncbi:MAG TPA: aminodeoxychorismate/anthranilate synthase component II [Gemmatimonas sp.]|nr:aminodeoxychorismate/anthranilate synthase component II [Gemmatimonas sp.]